ncbi:MAG: hypothetical protein KDD94_14005, partial [Calditrichaeota bacterium]|nr:hypothetical protein [Calditrichota bacterium]
MKIALILLILIGVGCSDSTSDNKPVTVTELIDSGWNHFKNKDYNSSLQDFLAAKLLDSTNIEVLNGLGWTYLLLDDLNSSENTFNNGLAIDSNASDLHAGLSLCLASSESFNESIIHIEEVLRLEPSWTFEFGLEINFADLIFTESFLYFLLEDYENSLASIQLLDPNFSADIGTSNGINLLAD